VATGIIDTSKGVAALLVSTSLLALPASLIALPVAASIAGHIFPFYLRFRGGKGSATAIGVFIYLTSLEIASGRFWIGTLAMLLVVASVAYLGSRTGDVAGLVTFFGMAVVTPLELGFTNVSIVDTGLSVFLLVSIFLTAVKHGVFRLERTAEIKIWRLAVRPLALLFIPIDLFFGRMTLLLLMGAVALIFLATDLIRLVTKWKLHHLFKLSESGRFSSMSLFLVSVFLTFLVFPDRIPYLALVFVTIGDLGGKLFGLKYGRHRLFKSRTLEGSLGFISLSLLSSYVLLLLVGVPLLSVLLGSIFAAVVELFSEDLDDNFTVGLLSGGFLYALRLFASI